MRVSPQATETLLWVKLRGESQDLEGSGNNDFVGARDSPMGGPWFQNVPREGKVFNMPLGEAHPLKLQKSIH